MLKKIVIRILAVASAIILCLWAGTGMKIPIKTPIPTPPMWFEKLLDHPTCALPCWEGLIPGFTTAEEAYKILSLLNGVKVAYNEFDLITYLQTDWIIDNGTGHGYALIDKETKVLTDLFLDIQTSRVPVQKVVMKYGQPTHLVVDGNHSEIFSIVCDIYMVFVHKGMAVKFSVPVIIKDGKFSFLITPEEGFYEIRLVDISELAHRISQKENGVFTWNGYGKYSGDW
jgi:hypothetical protein